MFEFSATTLEDRQRTGYYREETKRDELQRQSASLNEFLDKLELEVNFRKAVESDVDRLCQLSERTTQFNTTGQQLIPSNTRKAMSASLSQLFVVEAVDRFGDYGKCGVVSVSPRRDIWNVDLFALSCRALGRNVEYRVCAALAKEAQLNGIIGFQFDFRTGPRNFPAYEFVGELLRQMGSMQKVAASNYISTEVLLNAEEARKAFFLDPTKLEVAYLRRKSLLSTENLTSARRCFHKALISDIPNVKNNDILEGKDDSYHRSLETRLVTPTQKILASIWRELLHLKTVKLEDDFFLLGGQSLIATQVASRVRDVFEIEVPLSILFEARTLRKLAQVIEDMMITDAEKMNEEDPT